MIIYLPNNNDLCKSFEYFYYIYTNKCIHNMVTMGIDPSINCTGVCIYDDIAKTHIYYMIAGKCTKKMKEFKNDNVHIIEYGKNNSRSNDYAIKEVDKTLNVYNICTLVKDIIDIHEPDQIKMEGISYGSKGSAALADLAGLNFALRMSILQKNIEFTIIAPTSIKKFAVGNGGVEKDVMIASWKKLDKNISEITEIKLDDLADSYFIAHYN